MVEIECDRGNASRVMNGSRDKKLSLAINDERTTIVADIAGWGHCQCDQYQQQKKTHFHFAINLSLRWVSVSHCVGVLTDI